MATPPATARPPDIFVVVLDTVRKDFLSGGTSPAPGQAFLDRLRQQCFTHDRAVAPAPWTAPTHASLLTGVPPWEHQVHLKGKRALSPSQDTLAETLRGLGYRTASFAANSYIGPSTGMQRGFEQWCTGGKHDWTFRGFPGPPTFASASRPRGLLGGPRGPSRLLYYSMHEPIWTYLGRWPTAADRLVRLTRSRRPGPDGLKVSGWIDDELGFWLEGIPAREPVFVFLNYMEAHEPYFGVLPDRPNPPGPPRGSAIRQDSRGWASGRWVPSDEQLDNLRRAYATTFEVLDRRISDLVEMLQTTGRWENSLFLLTSDHGQALGEGGMLYHAIQTSEPLVRVPLWIRPPPGGEVALSPKSWFSLTSLRSAIEGMVQGARAGETPTLGAAPAADAAPPSVLTIADGVGGQIRPHVPTPRLTSLERLMVTGYLGSTKLSFDLASNSCSLVDLERDPAGRNPTPVVPTGELEPLYRQLVDVAQRAFGHAPPPGDAVEKRLAGWGY